jgi:hypothetical protein
VGVGLGVPATQVSATHFNPGPQSFPQNPQLVSLVLVSVHSPEQSTSPGKQQVLPTQSPLVQSPLTVQGHVGGCN